MLRDERKNTTFRMKLRVTKLSSKPSIIGKTLGMIMSNYILEAGV